MRIQTPLEEKLNACSHGLGAFLGLIALYLLVCYNTGKSDWSLFSVVVYALSIIILFSASTFYHATKNDKRKHYFRIVDHISIYILIAGTYTPVCLIALQDSLGWPLFYTVWGIALFGAFLKLFFTGRFEVVSTLLYLVMGWLIVFDISNLSAQIGSQGMWFLAAGGSAYSLGIIFYAVQKIPYNHVIWHLFVLTGAVCHFLMIFNYVI
ncbi:hemolysin III family protein [Tamlana sp. 2_MG-2023]|uniref:PAQR family membrane homeostasis protein TrhA n=1 Tax=unclassified Tamlana TaxID=2614803 RepID=UPI0026E1FDA3|nr:MULTISPECIES: hemolysin III family protein [unclassified Tamlana]MDO6759261.1 hemolysin III family protein [Tamlana sp. 2_MG-2023]MDO6790600.1 hemolysin III family protein [Tamlana sp. 1_MG-2023]